MKLGIDRLIEREKELLRGRRIGLLCNRASVTSTGQKTSDVLGRLCNIVAFFAPEHGLDQQAEYMVPVEHQMEGFSGRPIYSLYGPTYESLRPTPNMLEKMDLFIIDLQDIGTRYYTYAATMAFCMQACAAKGIEVIVCDRPNPLGGLAVEGALVKKGYDSFVGYHPLPNRHGMTMGELAKLFNIERHLKCQLSVMGLEGWRREHYFDKTDLPWVNPSPNMRSLNAALLYPGMCLLEATNISEGRGTATPFEIFGAPFVDRKLIKVLKKLNWEGVKLSFMTFTPTADKFAQKLCQGIKIEITDRGKICPYKIGLELVKMVFETYPDAFRWRDQPYEFVTEIPAIDLLTGSDLFRTSITEMSEEKWKELLYVSSDFLKVRTHALLY